MTRKEHIENLLAIMDSIPDDACGDLHTETKVSAASRILINLPKEYYENWIKCGKPYSLSNYDINILDKAICEGELIEEFNKNIKSKE